MTENDFTYVVDTDETHEEALARLELEHELQNPEKRAEHFSKQRSDVEDEEQERRRLARENTAEMHELSKMENEERGVPPLNPELDK